MLTEELPKFYIPRSIPLYEQRLLRAWRDEVAEIIQNQINDVPKKGWNKSFVHGYIKAKEEDLKCLK